MLKCFSICCSFGSILMFLAAATTISTAYAADVATSVEKPNILFIITDQQYIDVMSAAGNPHLKTPAMDSLAARGVRFERSYCTYPVCTPARASLVTSRMPHDICEYPREPDNYPSPPATAELPPLPANFRAIQNEPSLLAAVRERQKKAKDALSRGSETKWREYRWAYYDLTEVVDELIGQVVKALEDSPYADNTLIVFTSDHGEMAGSHQLRTKNYMYEEATAVPLIICPARKYCAAAAVDRRHLVSGLDILPTMCDYAGLPIPDSLEGVSLRPLVDNPNSQPEIVWRDHLVLEINDRTEVRMVRSNRYKYIVYAKGESREQLFDLETDPGETTNLVQQPQMKKVVESHRDMLRQWMKQTNDTFILAP